MTTSHKPNVLFWVIGIIGLIWNAMGVFQFFAENFMKETLYEGYTEEQIALMDNMPAWISVIFSIFSSAGVFENFPAPLHVFNCTGIGLFLFCFL